MNFPELHWGEVGLMQELDSINRYIKYCNNLIEKNEHERWYVEALRVIARSCREAEYLAKRSRLRIVK